MTSPFDLAFRSFWHYNNTHIGKSKIPKTGDVLYLFDIAKPLGIEIPHAQIQVRRIDQPDPIGNLQLGGGQVCLIKEQGHSKNQRPQQHQPEKGQKIGLRVEKDQAPEEIDDQLKDIQVETLTARRGGRGQPDPCRADAHEGVQNGPDHRKYPVRRRQGRFGYGGAEVGHAAPGQPAGEGTHGLGE